MYTKLVLTDDIEEMFDYNNNVSNIKFNYSRTGVEIYLKVDGNNSLKEESLKLNMKDFLLKMKELNDEASVKQEKLRFKTLDSLSLNSIYDAISTCDYIQLNFRKIDLLNYIKNNKLLSKRKIIINENIKLNDFNLINELINKYQDYKKNIYVNFEYNNFDPVSLENCLNTMNKIKEITDRINSYDLSELEKIMYAYDIARNKKYKSETKSDSPGLSRDLTSVLFGDKIVCEGYCNIFKAILNSLEIKTEDDILYGKGSPHIRTVINVSDKKYNIKGIYFFDPTMDSIKSEYDNLYNYSAFARTKNQIDSDKMIYSYEYKYRKIKTDCNSFIKLFNKKGNVFNEMKYRGFITRLCNFAHTRKINLDVIDEKTVKKIENLFSKFNKPIPDEAMIQIMFNVRKIEHDENEKILFDPKTLKLISNISNWHVSDERTNEEKLLDIVFGVRKKEYDEIFNDFIQKIDKNKILSLSK